MKRISQFALAVWALNFWLVYMAMVNPAMYNALRASGAEFYSCIDWDDQGRSYPSAACVDPRPEFSIQ